jgi:hypothetical protein
MRNRVLVEELYFRGGTNPILCVSAALGHQIGVVLTAQWREDITEYSTEFPVRIEVLVDIIFRPNFKSNGCAICSRNFVSLNPNFYGDIYGLDVGKII